MAKKQPSNTTQSLVKAMVNVSLPPIEAPRYVKLRECDHDFWRGIISSRARDEWCETDLVVAAQLSRCQADIERESELLEVEGNVIENQRGTPIMNPRHTVLEQLARKQMAFMRSLGLSGFTAKGGKEVAQKARKLERDMARTKDELAEEDLLAL
jgi:glutamine synthetase